MSYLTEEHEHAHVKLQQSGDAERPPLCAAQWVKQQLSAQRSFPLLRPNINLLLAVSKCTVLPVLALLTLLHLCCTRTVEKPRINVKKAVTFNSWTRLQCSGHRPHAATRIQQLVKW